MATAAAKSSAGRARSSMATMNAKSGARKHRRPGATVRIATIVTIAPIARFGSGPWLRPACLGQKHQARSCAMAAVAGRSLQDVTLNTEPWRRAGLVRAAAVTYRFADEVSFGGTPMVAVIPGRASARTRNDVFQNAQIALAAMFTINATSAVLKTKEMMPCAVAVRRMVLSVMPTSETCAVMPITNEKYTKSQ